MKTNRPKGTNDIAPGEQFGWLNSARWAALEQQIREVAHLWGYQELRPPMFEHTDLFLHGTGSTTDIVNREMYNFEDRGGRNICLRPEFTPGLVRAFLENGLHNQAQPTKLFTYGPAFRYERPQSGRFRQFNQFDVEVFGAEHPAIDAEVIALGLELAGRVGLTGLVVSLNSIGCPKCRAAYRARLQEHFRPHLAELCGDCNRRINENPLRLLDCKVDASHPAQATAPMMIDHLCGECSEHFDGLQKHLDALDVRYEINPRIVRGLDYYTKTVFEVLHPGLGAQSALWGGGRYDGLVETLGGKPTPGVGFGMGMERILMVLEQLEGGKLEIPPAVDVFLVSMGDEAWTKALSLAYEWRRQGIATDVDYLSRGFRAQLRYADRLGAQYVAILGDEELARGEVALKNLASGEQASVAFASVPEQVRKGV